MRRNSSMRNNQHQHVLGGRVCVKRDLFLIMGEDEADLLKYATAATFAIITEPWRLEIDLWRSFINVDMAFLRIRKRNGWIDWVSLRDAHKIHSKGLDQKKKQMTSQHFVLQGRWIVGHPTGQAGRESFQSRWAYSEKAILLQTTVTSFYYLIFSTVYFTPYMWKVLAAGSTLLIRCTARLKAWGNTWVGHMSSFKRQPRYPLVTRRRLHSPAEVDLERNLHSSIPTSVQILYDVARTNK